MDNAHNRRAEDRRAPGALQWGEPTAGAAPAGVQQPAPERYGYTITPRAPHLGGGWRLQLLDGSQEAGGGVYPAASQAESDDAYQEALDDGEAWLTSRGGLAIDPRFVTGTGCAERREGVLLSSPAATNTAGIDLDPAQLCIGVSNNDQGVHICIMQPHTDGTTTLIYSGKAPAGDSYARFALARRSLTSGAPAEPVAKVVETDIDISVIDVVLPVGTKLYAVPVHDAAAPSAEQARILAKVISYLVANNHMRWKGFDDDETFSDDNAEFQTILKLVERAIPHLDLSAGAAAKTEQAPAIEQWRLQGTTAWYDVSTDDKDATLGTHTGYEKRMVHLVTPSATAAGAGSETRIHLRWRQDHAEWRECAPDAAGALEFIGKVPVGYHGACGAAGAGSAQPRAVQQALAELEALSPEELRAELNKHAGKLRLELPSFAAQPEALDERALFEREALRLDIVDDEGLERNERGEYIDEPVQAAWGAWQAHAALPQQPAPATQQAGAAAPAENVLELLRQGRDILADLANSRGVHSTESAAWMEATEAVVDAALARAPLPAQGGVDGGAA